VNRGAKDCLRFFKACVDDAPEGTYEAAKDLNLAIGEAMDGLMSAIRGQGLLADNSGLAFELESAMYEYVKRSNPGSTIFPVSEGFGEAMDGPARERVIAQAIANRDFIASLKGGGA